ncbi:MAG: response regulator [Pseudanabaenaceae cyanobacterium]
MSTTQLNLGAGADAQMVRDATLNVLLPAMRVMSRSTGILHVETKHHHWKILLQGNGMVLMELEGAVIPTLVSKFGAKGIKFGRIPELEVKQHNRPYCYAFVHQVYKRFAKQTEEVLLDVINENFLALHLEDRFTFTWFPTSDLVVDLPAHNIAELEKGIMPEVRRWQTEFEYVKHPFQRIQLLDAAALLARVGNDNFPLFAKVTTGQHRITEIAENFKQPLYRTAVLLDRLAQKQIISVLPLPEVQHTPVTAPEDSHRSSHSNEPKIFIVDDSTLLLNQFRSLLEGWGYQVEVTDDPTQATQLIMQYRPSVVFADINMPSLNGFELIKQIRRHPDMQNLPLVLVTGENNMTNSFRARWANCRFIAKAKSPSDTERFRDELRELLRELAPLSTDTLV